MLRFILLDPRVVLPGAGFPFFSVRGVFTVRCLRSAFGISVVLVLASCGDGMGPGNDPSLSCSAASVRALAVGEHQIIDPLQDGACVRLPAAPAGGAEHLYVPVSTASQEVNDGVSGPYLATGQSAGVAAARAAPLPSPRLSAFQRPLAPEAFHDMLRNRERELARSPSAALFSKSRLSAGAAAVPPVVGEKRTFQV